MDSKFASLLVLITALAGGLWVISRPAAAGQVDAPTAAVTKVTPPPRRTWTFAEEGVTFDSRFAGARVSQCSRLAAGEYLVVTEPENKPINNSAWFAFKATAIAPRAIVVQVKCAEA